MRRLDQLVRYPHATGSEAVIALVAVPHPSSVPVPRAVLWVLVHIKSFLSVIRIILRKSKHPFPHMPRAGYLFHGGICIAFSC